MSGKTWEPTRRGIRDLNRHIRKGTVVYTVSKQARHMAPWNDAELWSAHEFTWRSPITGHWMTGHKSAEGLLQTEGTVYEQPPRGMRPLAGPGPQVAGPLGDGEYEGRLDEAEIRGLEKHVRDGSNPRHRRPIGSWRA
ncbi:hypothetical protein [Streptomyces sp. NPDC003832]